LSSEQRNRHYSCIHCGKDYLACPPDDILITSSMRDESRMSSIPISYTCEGCGKENKLFWGMG